MINVQLNSINHTHSRNEELESIAVTSLTIDLNIVVDFWWVEKDAENVNFFSLFCIQLLSDVFS